MPRALARAALSVAAPLLALTACTPSPGSGSGDEITRFHVDSAVLPDGTFEVTETITYDFGGEPSAGLWRDVPLTAPSSLLRDRSLAVTDVEVTSPSGAPAGIESLRERRGRLEMVIGDADAPVSGEQTYAISYTVHGALTGEDGAAELHWDFVGDGWGVPVHDVRVTVAAPGTESADCRYLRSVDYGDDERVEEEVCAAEHDGTTAVLSHDRLQPGMPLSGVVRLPGGTVEVAEPSYTLPRWLVPPPWLTPVGVVSLSASLAVCYGILSLAVRVGRFRAARRTFPDALPDIPPALAGFVYRKERLRPEHLMALLVRLEEKGHVASARGDDGWVFTRSASDAGTTPSERALLETMFDGSGRSDLPRLSRRLTGPGVRALERALTREGRDHGLIRPAWLWWPAFAVVACLFTAALFTPHFLNESTPLRLSGMTAFASALPVVAAVLMLLPHPRTPYGRHVGERLAAVAEDPGAAEPVLAVALGAPPERLVGGGADVRAFYRDRDYRDRWDGDVHRRIRSAHVSRGGGGGTAGGGGGGGGGGRR